MDRTLFVIVGAGASNDAASNWPGRRLHVRPPLVKDLFDESHQEILARYPLAQSAAPEIRDALSGSEEAEPVSLERHLRKSYRDSEDAYDRRRYFSITLYLQDLLWQASSTQRVHFDNTDRLVASLLRSFPHVCFLTLNYDLILDHALAKLDPIRTMHDYVGYQRWSLLKLHGSVDWGYRYVDTFPPTEPPPDLDRHLDTEIHLARQQSDTTKPPRFAGGEYATFELFPALTVPVGEDDDETCPPEHLAFLERRLAAEDELDLLIIGYSAYDRTVLERIANSERRIRTLTIVNQDRVTAEQVAARLTGVIPQSMSGTKVNLAAQPFGAWCRSALSAFAAAHPAAIALRASE